MCIYTHRPQWVHLASSYSTNLNSRGDTEVDKTGYKEGRQLQEGKELFHEDSLAGATCNQEILGNWCLLEKTELSPDRWANTAEHE